jgi:hypothetical protein
MKKIILVSLLLVFYACGDSSTKNNESSKNSKEKMSREDVNYFFVDIELSENAEKIGLISILKDIHPEKGNVVLRDYLAKTSAIFYQFEKEPSFFVNVVDTLAAKHNLSKKIIASIIFSYKYEMVTKDEIIDDYIEEMEYYQNERQQY